MGYDLLANFATLFHAASLGIVALDRGGLIIKVNPALEQMFDYEPGVLVGQALEVLLPEPLRAGHVIDREAFMRSPHPRPMGQGLDLQGRRRDGQTFPIEVSLTHIGVDGESIAVAFVADISERKRAEQARARLAAIVDSSDDAIIGRGFDGTIFAWNSGAEQLYGYSADEAIGKSIAMLFPDGKLDELHWIDQRIALGEHITHFDSVRLHKSGQLLDVALTSSPIIDREGHIVGISTIARDISGQKRVEQAIIRQAALARLLQVVAVAANQAGSVHEALQTAVDEVCVAIGWPVGHAYLASDEGDQALASTTIWHVDEPEHFAALQAVTRLVQRNSPDDLRGRVVLSGKPEWITDFAALGDGSHFKLLSDVGVRAGFAFPVLVGAEVAAVLVFFAREAQSPDEALLEVMTHVGAQLGRVIERNRAEVALRESEHLYRTLAKNIPDGSVLLFDRNLRFTIADGSALQVAGLSRTMLEGRTLYDVLPLESAMQLEPLYQAALSGEPGELEITSGERVYMSYFLPVKNEQDEIFAGMAMSYDITRLKRIERELIEERALLARRVAERTADLSLANGELARAARLKDEFLANMSHELRTPLNSILGRCEALQEQIYGSLTLKQGEALRGIAESGRHLLTLINDILDLSKIEAGRIELDLAPVAVDMLCRVSLRMITQVALMRRINVTLTVDSMVEVVQADERRLKQILVNLLSNAVKFTPEGGEVGLVVRGDVVKGSVTFTVWDRGIGITAEDMPKLFKPFVQIDSSLSRQYAGTGLGLALVLRLAQAHGGSVSVESMPGQGSRFSVILPWSINDHISTTHLEQDDLGISIPPAAIRRVLVVEDSSSTAGQIVRYLGEIGIRVEVYPRGSGTLEQAIALQPDVIILDILLPDQSGWDVLVQLKAEPRTQAIPVIIVTVLDEPERVQELGAAALIVKPLDRAILLQTLQQVAAHPSGSPMRKDIFVASQENRPCILLAEDNQANIDLLQDYLQVKGYNVVVARNGSEALVRAQEDIPAIVLMDIQMPGMDGLEAIRRIRSEEQIRTIPIIALTALAMPGDRERCLKAGADHYLTKPIHLQSLLAMIETQLHEHREGIEKR